MRILHFVHNFPPEFRGGTELYVLNLARRQCRTGNEVLVVTGSARDDAGKDQQKELFEGVRVLRLFRRPEEVAYKIHPHYPRLSRASLEILRAFDPDLAHVHHWHHLSDDLVRLAKGDRFPVVLTLHDFFAVCPRFFRVKPGNEALCPSHESPGACFTCIREEHRLWPVDLVRDLYQRRLNLARELSAADFIYTFSRAVADFYGAIPWVHLKKVHVLPIGVLRPLARSKPTLDRARLRIVTWGGQAEVKGTHLLLEAASLPDLKGEVEVHVFGKIVDPDYRLRLERLARECGAVLHGFFPEAEKESLGARFDLAVFPTRAFETYSIVVDEALSMGLPVVATRPGAQSERVGEAGRVVPANDLGALADALRFFLDPEARLRAAQATERIRIGTMDGHWMKLAAVYGELVSRSRRRGRPRFLYCPPPPQGPARPDHWQRRSS